MKNIKLFSAFFVAAALASCSSDDDLRFADKSVELAKDGSQILVTVEESDVLTRSGYAQYVNPANGKINSKFIWTKDDRIKVYNTDTWRPQLYSCVGSMATIDGVDGQLFEYSGEEKYKGSKEGREYGIFPADSLNMKVEFLDDYRTELQVTIPTEMRYESNADHTYSSYASEGIDDNGRVVFNSIVPLFGYLTDEGTKLTFNYLSAVLRVDLTGVAAEGVHTLKLSSQTKQLSGKFLVENFDAAEFESNKIPVINTKEAENEDDKAIEVSFIPSSTQTDYTIYIPIPQGTYTGGEDLKLEYTAGSNAQAKTLAVLNGAMKYAEDTEEHKAGDYMDVKDIEETFTVGRGICLIASDNQAIEVSVSVPGKDVHNGSKMLKGLQTVIEQYANSVRDVVINVNTDADTADGLPAITVDNTKEVNYHTLTVPALKSNITLNVYCKVGTETGKVLTINGGKGSEGKLIINLKKTPAASMTIEMDASLSLSAIGANTISDITIKKVKDIALLGVNKDSKFGGEITTEENAISGDINIAGTFNKAVNLTTTGGDITIGTATFAKDTENLIASEAADSKAVVEGTVTNNGVLEITAENIDINGVIDSYTGGKKLVTNGAVTVAEKAIVKGNWTHNNGKLTVNGKHQAYTAQVNASEVVVAEGASMNTLWLNDNAASALIEGKVTSMKTVGAFVEIKGTVGTLTVTAPVATNETKKGGIVLTGGKITNIIEADYKTADKEGAVQPATKVYSTGAAEIANHKDENTKLVFYSLWDKKSVAESAAVVESVHHIYTAAQLASVQNQVAAIPYLFYATEIDMADGDWTGPTLAAVNFDGAVKNATIKNLNLFNAQTTDGIGFFGEVTGNAQITNIAFEDIKLDVNSAKVEQESGATKYTRVANNIGALIGKAGGQTTITNVTVKLSGEKFGSSLVVDSDNKPSQKGAVNIGGLVGLSENEITITNAVVSGTSTISGYHSLGGFVGNAQNNVTINGKSTSVSLTNVAVTYKTTEDQDLNVGKYGALVGTMAESSSATLTLGGSAADDKITAPVLTNANTLALGQHFLVSTASGQQNIYEFRYGTSYSFLGYSSEKELVTGGYTADPAKPTMKLNNANVSDGKAIANWVRRGN